MRQLNNSFINKYDYSTLLLQSSIIVLLALFFLLAPSTVLAEELTDNENAENSESFNEQASEDDDTTTEELAEDSESEPESDLGDEVVPSDNTDLEDEEGVEIPDPENNEEIENDGDRDVDDTDEVDEEEVDLEHDSEMTEEDELEDSHDENAEEVDAEEAGDDEDKTESENDEEKVNEDENTSSKKKATQATLSTKKNSNFGNGDRHNDVIQLKKDLSKLGFGGMNINDLYGSFTEQRVREFQKYYGLNTTGIADERTRSRINSIANSPLQEGKRHAKTIQLKKDLHKIGFGGMNINNLYGSFTAQQVTAFQKQYKLKTNGIADDVTLAKISSLAEKIFQEGDRHTDVIQLKKDLTKVGFGGMNINDLYGSFTAQRVIQFQEYFGLKGTGIADDNTHSKLNSVANSPLQEGKRHNDTIQLKQNLKKIGFGGMNINNLYGSFTAQRVSEFQKQNGLKVNGIADEVTLAKITSIADTIFQEGDRHDDIIQLKKDLTKVGFGGMNLNDLYGSFTAQRVNQFQKYFGLKATGITEVVTRSKLQSVANSPLQEGKRHNDTIQLKKDLNKIGFGGMNINNLYGSFTAQRVSEFQKQNGLKVNGIADEVTLAKITSLAAKPSKVIYLDAGHGGSDPGAIGNGLQEKDVTLDIALRTKKELEAAGYTVIMSRTTDKYLSLSERTNHANSVNADIFVSIHINAGGGTGIETWKMANGPKPKESNTLATHIQNETIKQTGSRDRGVKDQNLHVNRESNMPSALVELGFIDTKADADKLKQASFKNKAANGIANGIIKYFA